ncbi:LrgB family protein [Ensifer sp.]|uniref:LrgB family protein n=1 Tax=Ensifer sp. TaxID=1872086 RepID=UPI000DD7325B|nr:LrgB family protein [Ensifer sp.]
MDTSGRVFELWVYLSTSPLLWLTVTIGAFIAAQRLAALSGFNPIVNPVLIAVALVVLILTVTGTSYSTYFDGAQFVHFALGPATVALAVPLYRNRLLIRQNFVPVLVALFAGSLTAIVCATSIALLLGAPDSVAISLAPKSATAGIAVGISQQLGGDPALTALLVIFTGVLGAIIVTPLMNLLRIKNYAARGFAAGLTSHGIGTARAFQVNEIAGTFSGLAMALNGILTSAVAAIVLGLLL